MRLFFCVLLALAGVLALAADPSAETVMATLRGEHPRLLLREARVAELRALAADDPAYKSAYDAFLVRARLYQARPPVQPSNDWNGWRETLARVFAFGLAWRMTGEATYAASLKTTLLTACDFPDWHAQQSFLDTAEMTFAVALGYDWLYGELSAEERGKIRTALVAKGLQPGKAVYDGTAPASWWPQCNHNWNTVCNAGMMAGALAVGDTDAEIARPVLAAAVTSLRRALPSYDPDGAWMEGPYYWEYATRYTVLALACLQSALGTDFALSDRPGLAATWRYAVYTTAPDGLTQFGYADTLEHHWNLPFLFWIATRYNLPQAAEAERRYFGTPHPWWKDPAAEVKDPRFPALRALDLIWYVPPPISGRPLEARALDARFTGLVELASFRGSWSDDKTLCLFVKAGPNGALVNHGHCDAGSFELYAQGVRWARDPGRENYGAGYFENGTAEHPGKRWSYLKANARGHNVAVLNNSNQHPFATAALRAFASTPAFAFTTIDLTPVYVGSATAAARGFAVYDHRAVLVQDEFTLDTPTNITWGMNTEADIATDGAKAVLTRWGQKLEAQLLSPAGAAFTVAPFPNDPKTRRLTVHLPEQTGTVRLAVLLVPVWPDGKKTEVPEMTALGEWQGR